MENKNTAVTKGRQTGKNRHFPQNADCALGGDVLQWQQIKFR